MGQSQFCCQYSLLDCEVLPGTGLFAANVDAGPAMGTTIIGAGRGRRYKGGRNKGEELPSLVQAELLDFKQLPLVTLLVAKVTV